MTVKSLTVDDWRTAVRSPTPGSVFGACGLALTGSVGLPSAPGCRFLMEFREADPASAMHAARYTATTADNQSGLMVIRYPERSLIRGVFKVAAGKIKLCEWMISVREEDASECQTKRVCRAAEWHELYTRALCGHPPLLTVELCRVKRAKNWRFKRHDRSLSRSPSLSRTHARKCNNAQLPNKRTA